VDARKGLKFKKFPQILMVHLKRFDYNYDTRMREKLNHYVKFPLLLDANKYLDENFELAAIRHPPEKKPTKTSSSSSSTSSSSVYNTLEKDKYASTSSSSPPSLPPIS